MTSVDFGVELWDKYPVVSNRCDETLEICRDMVNFFQKLSQIEKDYGKALLALTKTESVSGSKGVFKASNIASRERGSLQQAWVGIQFELEKIAKAHTEIGDQTKTQMIDPLIAYVKDTEKWKKSLQKTGEKSLEDMKIAAEKMAKKAENLTAKRKDYEKIQQSSSTPMDKKVLEAEKKLLEAEEDYRLSETAANDTAVMVYTTALPVVLHDFQDLEEKRIDFISSTIRSFQSILQVASPTLDECVKALQLSLNLISKESDISSFVAENKSGKLPPSSAKEALQGLKAGNNITKKLDQMTASPPPSSSLSRQSTTPLMRAAGIGSSSNHNTNGSGSFDTPLTQEELGGLSTDEKKQRIRERMENVRKTIQVEKNSMEGMKNLMQMYAAQPDMQNKVIEQINTSQHKYEELEKQRKTYEDMLAAMGEVTQDDSVEILIPLKPPVNAKALFDFTGTGDGELSFVEGEIITLLAKGSSGWAEARNQKGVVGLIPLNYVEE